MPLESGSDEQTDFKVFMAETVIYRQQQGERLDRLSGKIDCILDKFNNLPCREHLAKHDGLVGQVMAIWVFVSAIVLAVIGAWVKK